ncbi:hypothetical protein [Rufibacter quisquiliarum]|uniref:Uncharacterized protein n=1 Tax=Rufibacter quisquiliarum TaxID=1549639 RepID=A0A839G9D4_9BACT|nr:hypothetical protein [Rufibacter quisquiliarum]MBA9076094.1 hypothetical protein [Rufibacter quisquiliarum]
MRHLVVEVQEIAKDLRQDQPELTLVESLQIAATIQQNRVLERAFCLSSENIPVALEAIAIQLGSKGTY